jgi:hypothetical protein
VSEGIVDLITGWWWDLSLVIFGGCQLAHRVSRGVAYLNIYLS